MVFAFVLLAESSNWLEATTTYPVVPESDTSITISLGSTNLFLLTISYRFVNVTYSDLLKGYRRNKKRFREIKRHFCVEGLTINSFFWITRTGFMNKTSNKTNIVYAYNITLIVANIF